MNIDEQHFKRLLDAYLKGSATSEEKKLLDAKYEVFLDQCRTQQEYRNRVDEAVKGFKWD